MAVLKWEDGARQDMGAVIEYIEAILHRIDPDFFNIPEEKLAYAKSLLSADAADISYQDMLFMQTLADAGAEYGARKSGDGLAPPDAAKIARLSTWLAQTEDALFRAKSQGGA